jgi:hypothetical protein
LPEDERADAAIHAERLVVKGVVLLRDAHVKGRLRLFDASATGLQADRSVLDHPYGLALDAAMLRVDGPTMLRGARIRGGVSLSGAAMASLQCDGIRMRRWLGPPRTWAGRSAGFVLAYARIRGPVLLRDADLDGGLDVKHARIDGGIALDRADVVHPVRALDAAVMQCDGPVSLLDGCRILGDATFAHARLGLLADDKQSWPRSIVLEGLTYTALDWSKTSWHDRRQWLSRQPEYRSQPYLQLAKAYRAVGLDRDARRASIERHNARMRRRPANRLNVGR